MLTKFSGADDSMLGVVDHYSGQAPQFLGVVEEYAGAELSPATQARIRAIGDELALLGYDESNPELLGSVLKNIIGGIRNAISSRLQKGITIRSSGGGSSGVSTPPSLPAESGGAVSMLKNPMVLAGAGVAAVALVLILKKNRKGGRRGRR